MQHMFDMLLAVFDRAALMLICLFFLTRTPLFRPTPSPAHCR